MGILVNCIGYGVGAGIADHLYCKITGQSTDPRNAGLGRTAVLTAGGVAGMMLAKNLTATTGSGLLVGAGLFAVGVAHGVTTDYYSGQPPEVV